MAHDARDANHRAKARILLGDYVGWVFRVAAFMGMHVGIFGAISLHFLISGNTATGLMTGGMTFGLIIAIALVSKKSGHDAIDVFRAHLDAPLVDDDSDTETQR